MSNIVGGNDGDAVALVVGDAGAVDSRPVVRFDDGIGPGTQIRMIGGGEAAAFFDIQKNHGAFGESFFLRAGDCFVGVLRGFLRGSRRRFQLARFASAKEDYEAEALRVKKFAFTGPSVDFFAGRWAEPVAGEGVGLA